MNINFHININDLFLYLSILICIFIALFFFIKQGLKRYYKHVYQKHGIDGFRSKYGFFSKIFAKPEEILGLTKKNAEMVEGLEQEKNQVYMHNYQEYVNENPMYKDDEQIVGISKPIGPMTEKIFKERMGNLKMGFNVNKFISGYWVNYVMMGKGSGKDKDSISR